ncbi:MAG: type II secretion system F family protein [Bdellovibrionales bacterium]
MNILANELLISVGVGIGIFTFSYLMSDRIIGWLSAKSLGSREYVLNRFETMFVENSKQKVTYTMLVMSFGLGGLFFFLLWPNVILGALVGAAMTYAGWQLPKIAVDSLYERRCAKFISQLVVGLTLMSNGLRSGLSINQSIDRACQNVGGPFRQEFEFVLSQMKIGLSLEEALNGLYERIPKQDVQMFVMSVNILNQTGGDMASTFQTITDTIRERQKIYQKIEAMTAQGKTQGLIMTMVPFFLLGMFALMDPAYIKPLFNSTLGIIFLIMMVALQLTGGYFMKKVVTIEV